MMDANYEKELLEILASLRDGSVSQEQLKRLNAICNEDDDARRLYAEYMYIHASLLRDYDCSDEIMNDQKSPPASPVTMDSNGRFLIQGLSQICQNRVYLAFTLFALVLISAYFLWGTRSPEDTDKLEIARVLSIQGVRWADGQPERFESQPLVAGDLIELATGNVAMEFTGGTKALLFGPAKITLDSNMKTKLLAGRLNVYVPPAAKGFTIDTLAAKIVDLGTEISVNVIDGDASEVRVISGAVEVDCTRPIGIENKKPIIVRAGRAMKITASGQTTEFEIAMEQFQSPRNIAISEEYLRYLRYSQQLRRDPDLVAYYPFLKKSKDSYASNQAAATTGKHNLKRLRVSTPSWTSGRWEDKGGLNFSALKKQRLFNLDWSTVDFDDELTMAVWLRQRTDRSSQTIATVWPDSPRDDEGMLFHFSLRERGPAIALSFDGITGTDFFTALDGERVEADEGWVHVAFTMKANKGPICLYKNGKKLDTTHLAYGPFGFPESTGPFVLGGRADGGTCFDGVIDEVAIFRRCLTPNEIQSMYEVGKPTITRR